MAYLRGLANDRLMIVGEAIFGLGHFAKAFTITVPQSNVPNLKTSQPFCIVTVFIFEKYWNRCMKRRGTKFLIYPKS